MMNTRVFKAALPLLAGLSFFSLAAGAQAQIAELRKNNIALSINRADVSVSGISSGAAMAFQLHVAHSKDLVGAGLVAGPPFRCADLMQGQTPPVTSDITATNMCTAYYKKIPALEVPGVAGRPIELSRLSYLAKDAFDRRAVDPQSGLCGDRVYLIAGGDDQTVPANVTNATKGLYETLLGSCADKSAGQQIVSKVVPGMPHTMPTTASPNQTGCVAGSPYIANCGMDGAADMMAYLHHRENTPQANRPADPNNLIRFDQHAVIGPGNPTWRMHKYGYVYVPEACKNGTSCALHIALHGCHQNQDQINQESYDPKHTYLFAADAGYNDYAERNNIVVLYPQAQNTEGVSGISGNPSGCWDWWGYNGAGYWRKDAPQIRIIWKFVEALSRR